MNPATKQLLRANLRFLRSLALIFGFLVGFLMVMGLGGSISDGAEFWSMGLMTSAMITMLIFIPLFLLSLSLQFALIYLRHWQQENNQRSLLIGILLSLLFLVFAIPFLNFGGVVILAIAGLWSLRRVNHWFSAETEKAKRGLDEAPEKAKRTGRWQPSRLLIYALVSLIFACAAYTYFVTQIWGV